VLSHSIITSLPALLLLQPGLLSRAARVSFIGPGATAGAKALARAGLSPLEGQGKESADRIIANIKRTGRSKVEGRLARAGFRSACIGDFKTRLCCLGLTEKQAGQQKDRYDSGNPQQFDSGGITPPLP
jgi:hypothetical protein